MTARRAVPSKADVKRIVAGAFAGGAGRVVLEVAGARIEITAIDLAASETEADAVERKMRRAFGE